MLRHTQTTHTHNHLCAQGDVVARKVLLLPKTVLSVLAFFLFRT